MNHEPAVPSVDTRRGNRPPGIAAIALIVVGVVLLIVSFTAVNWSVSAPFSVFRHKLDAGDVDGDGPAFPLSHVYFSWLAWVLLAGVVVFGLLGALLARRRPWLSVIGCLFGVAGTVFTYFAWYGATYFDTYLVVDEGVGVGLYLAMAGFAIAAIGAALGPFRITISGREPG